MLVRCDLGFTNHQLSDSWEVGLMTTKIRALLDALGNPANLMLTAGQIHDLACAQELIENADPEALIAEKAYDADPLINTLTEREIAPVIPPQIQTSNAIAISHFTANATSSSASSIKLSTFGALRPATTNSPEIFSQPSNWSRLSSFSTEDRP